MQLNKLLADVIMLFTPVRPEQNRTKQNIHLQEHKPNKAFISTNECMKQISQCMQKQKNLKQSINITGHANLDLSKN